MLYFRDIASFGAFLQGFERSRESVSNHRLWTGCFSEIVASRRFGHPRAADTPRSSRGAKSRLTLRRTGTAASTSQKTSRARITSKALTMTPVSTKAETAQRFDQHCAVPKSHQRFTLAPDALAHGQSWQAGKLAGVGPRHHFFHCSSQRATRTLQSVFPPSPALGGRPRKRIAWLRHAPSRRKPTAPSEVRWWRSLSLALSAALARPSGGPPLARSSGRPSPAHAAWPWLGQPRLSAAFPGAGGLPAHVEHADGHRLTPPRGDADPARSGPATPLGGRPTSPAIVGHAGAIWIGRVLPSAAFQPSSVIRLRGRRPLRCAPTPARGRASPGPTALATRLGERQTAPVAAARADGF